MGLIGVENGCDEGDETMAAPPKEHWLILLDEARLCRTSGDAGIPRVGGRKKARAHPNIFTITNLGFPTVKNNN